MMESVLKEWEATTLEAGLRAREGRLKEARIGVQRVLRAAPDFVPALEVLARIDWYRADYAATRRTIRRLTRLNPHEPGYRLLDALAAIHMGDLVGAAWSLDLAARQATEPAFIEQVVESRRALEAQATEAIRFWCRGNPTFAQWFDRDPVAAAQWLGVPVDANEATRTRSNPVLVPALVPPGGLASRPN